MKVTEYFSISIPICESICENSANFIPKSVDSQNDVIIPATLLHEGYVLICFLLS